MHIDDTGKTRNGQEVHSETIGVHYWRATFHPPEGGHSVHETVLEVLGDLLEDVIWEDHGGRQGYREGVQDPVTASALLWDMAQPGQECCTLDLKGDMCEILGLEGLAALEDAVKDRTGGTCNLRRVDVPWDTNAFTPDDLYQKLLENPDYLHMQAHRDKVGRESEGLDNPNTTTRVGSRQSDRFLRVYDKRGPTRIELECKDKWAQKVWEKLREHGASCIPGIIRDYLDLPGWRPWVEALEDAAAVRLRAFSTYAEKAEEKLEASRAWVVKSVLRTMGRVASYLSVKSGGEKAVETIAEAWIHRGLEKLTEADTELIGAAMRGGVR